MILVRRPAEPPELGPVRATELAKLRALRASGKEPTKDDISGYAIVKEALWRAQHYKCCYCEFMEQRSFNDVEHYRPKTSANRGPGCTDRHGYWWLAFTWENLLFACAGCNRSGKNDRFPLRAGSVALDHEELPPGREHPLLIDPAVESGVKHIQFVPNKLSGEELWIPQPRNGSEYGKHTIEVCDLDREDLVELYTRHVRNNVDSRVKRIEKAITSGRTEDIAELTEAVRAELLESTMMYVGLSYDALVHFTQDKLTPLNFTWPMPI